MEPERLRSFFAFGVAAAAGLWPGFAAPAARHALPLGAVVALRARMTAVAADGTSVAPLSVNDFSVRCKLVAMAPRPIKVSVGTKDHLIQASHSPRFSLGMPTRGTSHDLSTLDRSISLVLANFSSSFCERTARRAHWQSPSDHSCASQTLCGSHRMATALIGPPLPQVISSPPLPLPSPWLAACAWLWLPTPPVHLHAGTRPGSLARTRTHQATGSRQGPRPSEDASLLFSEKARQSCSVTEKP